MNTITAILEPDADGSLHLPLPPELRHGKVRVEAKLEPMRGQSDETERRWLAMEALERLRKRNAFSGISDPVAWQRELREDKPLPGRE